MSHTDKILQRLEDERGLYERATLAREAASEIRRLLADNDRMRRALEIIAGEAKDKLQAAQAKAALANIGPR